MLWLFGAYITSVILILLMEFKKKYMVDEHGIIERQYYHPI